jgi:hypothetical protein
VPDPIMDPYPAPCAFHCGLRGLENTAIVSRLKSTYLISFLILWLGLSRIRAWIALLVEVEYIDSSNPR